LSYNLIPGPIKKTQKQDNMFNRVVVQEALKRCLSYDNNPAAHAGVSPVQQSIVISQLIHDIFGGEILKTHKKKKWHFYNLIDGERIDLSLPEAGTPPEDNYFEDICSTPDETCKYLEQEDYSTFFMSFVIEFEEIVGLKKYQAGYST
jgi:hypothetical protein